MWLLSDRCSVDGRKRYANDKCGRKSFWKRSKTAPFSFENWLVWTGPQLTITISRESANFYGNAFQCRLIHTSQLTLQTIDRRAVDRVSIDCQLRCWLSIFLVTTEYKSKRQSRCCSNLSINTWPRMPLVVMIWYIFGLNNLLVGTSSVFKPSVIDVSNLLICKQLKTNLKNYAEVLLGDLNLNGHTPIRTTRQYCTVPFL